MPSLDLEKHLTFYGAHHHDRVNILIHMFCVPLILVTTIELLTNIGPFFHLPPGFTVPYLDANVGTFVAFGLAALYVLLEPVAGTALGLICLALAAGTNYLRLQDPVSTNQASAGVFIVSWLLQFIGHGAFEGRAPALLDNLFQAIFLAPLFVWLELLFFLRYRPELKARVSKSVESAVAKFKADKEKKAE